MLCPVLLRVSLLGVEFVLVDVSAWYAVQHEFIVCHVVVVVRLLVIVVVALVVFVVVV